MILTSKIIISGEIEILTGLHIGGSSTNMNIGETDLNVIKAPHNGEPIIPGSSLKGKLRSMLAKIEGADKIEKESNDLKNLFGYSKEGRNNEKYITRLIVRDSYLTEESVKELKEFSMENDYTEIKWENTVNRTKGSAEHPRQIERVPKGAKFTYEMILDVYNEDLSGNTYRSLIAKAMKLLEDDYLGGNGTRGYGRIKFHEKEDQIKPVASYASH